MLRKIRKKTPKRSSKYIPAPTLPVLTTPPPIPWRFKKFHPDPNFHATLNKFAEYALPEEAEPEPPKPVQPPKAIPPDPPKP